jgi:YD repeat-containing protein
MAVARSSEDTASPEEGVCHPNQPRTGFFNIGHLTTASKTVGGVSVGSQTLDHDGQGRPAKQTWTVDAVTYTATTGFAPGGEILWRTFPDGDSVGSTTSRWTYDPAGRLFAIPGIITSIAYDPDSQAKQVTYANGVTTVFGLDNERRWLDRVTTFNAGGNLLLLDYLHDNIGRITSVTSNRAGESWTYSYDQLDQLLVGRQLEQQRARPDFHLQFVRQHAVEQLTDGTKNFTWDAENRLLTAGTTSSVYAPDGTRLKKVTGAATILYLGVDIEKNGATWTKYPHQDAVRVNTTTWLHRDHGAGADHLARLYRREARPGDGADLPQRPPLRPGAGEVHLAGRVGPDAAGRRHQPLRLRRQQPDQQERSQRPCLPGCRNCKRLRVR